MGLRAQRSLAIRNRSDAVHARGLIRELGAKTGLVEPRLEELAIAALELATNLYLHAEEGRLMWRPLEPEGAGVELLALDRGPGMTWADARREGFSTAGTAGLGLGSLERLSDVFRVDSTSDGTVAVVRVYGEGYRRGLRVGVANRPYPGERFSGDDWVILARPSGLRVVLIDGLGHGVRAAEASATIVEAARRSTEAPPLVALEAMHEAARPTRGGSVAIADLEDESLSVLSIGNIACRILYEGDPPRGLPAQPGTVGAQLPRQPTVLDETLPRDARLILHSDGIRSRWTGDDLRRVRDATPSVIAGVLVRDFGRDNDDATCLVVAPARHPGGHDAA